LAADAPLVYDPPPCLTPACSATLQPSRARCRGRSPRSASTSRRSPVALLLALVIRTFVVQAFKIPSGSMLPTLEIGDHILVNKFLYGPRLEVPLTQLSFGHLPGLRAPAPGDVIVFVNPRNTSLDFIKRVDRRRRADVEIRDRQVYVDGSSRRRRRRSASGARACPTEPPFSWPRKGPDSCGPYTVPEGFVFVMGDNRGSSYDSRAVGPGAGREHQGRALIIYWSWDGPDRWVRWERIGRLVY
jgi:signal peptidase I